MKSKAPLNEQFRRMDMQGVRMEYAKGFYEATLQTVKNTLLALFYTVTAKAEKRKKTILSVYSNHANNCGQEWNVE